MPTKAASPVDHAAGVDGHAQPGARAPGGPRPGPAAGRPARRSGRCRSHPAGGRGRPGRRSGSRVSPAPPMAVSPGQGGRPGLAGREEARATRGRRAPRRWWRRATRPRRRRRGRSRTSSQAAVGRLSQPVVVVDLAVARARHRADDRGAPAWAPAAGPASTDGRRAVGERAAHEPGQRRRPPWARPSTSSTVTGLLELGQGVAAAPCRRALTAAAAICSTVVPPLVHD